MRSTKKAVVFSVMFLLVATMIVGATTPAGLLFQKAMGKGTPNVALADTAPDGDFYDLTVEDNLTVGNDLSVTAPDSVVTFGDFDYPINEIVMNATDGANLFSGENQHGGGFGYFSQGGTNYTAEFTSDGVFSVLGDTGGMIVGDFNGEPLFDFTGAYLASTLTQGQDATAVLHLSSVVVGEGEGEGETCGDAFLGTMQGSNPGSSLEIDAQGNVIIQLAGSSEEEMAQSAMSLQTAKTSASPSGSSGQTALQKAHKHNLGKSFPRKGSLSAR